VGIEVHVEALVAALDLKVVQLLRDAIRTADAHGAKERGTLGPAATFEPRRHIQPEPVIEPRRHLHPSPKIEPRVILQPLRLESVPTPACRYEPAPCPPVAGPGNPPAIQPPWRLVPWHDTPSPAPLARPAPPVKLPITPPDIISKGLLLDFFI
jgi:hypothetical protein